MMAGLASAMSVLKGDKAHLLVPKHGVVGLLVCFRVRWLTLSGGSPLD